MCFGRLKLALVRRRCHQTHQSRTYFNAHKKKKLRVRCRLLLSFVNFHQSFGQLLTQFTSLHNIYTTTAIVRPWYGPLSTRKRKQKECIKRMQWIPIEIEKNLVFFFCSFRVEFVVVVDLLCVCFFPVVYDGLHMERPIHYESEPSIVTNENKKTRKKKTHAARFSVCLRRTRR